MAENIKHARKAVNWALLAITALGLFVPVFLCMLLIQSNCGSTGAISFFSDVRAFHSSASC
ncbi:MAG: hypothetical protein ACRDT3_12480 [Glutamicibacter sp.]